MTNILEGVDGTAVLHADGLAFGPVFDSVADAWSFLHFIAYVDPAHLEWVGGVFPRGRHFYKLWDEGGRESRRAPVQFTLDDLTAPDFDDDDEPKSWSRKWSFSCDMDHYCFPLFLTLEGGSRDVGKALKRDGVIKSRMIDHGGDCLRVWFTSKAHGVKFIERLNGWLLANWHKGYPDDIPAREVPVDTSILKQLETS